MKWTKVSIRKTLQINIHQIFLRIFDLINDEYGHQLHYYSNIKIINALIYKRELFYRRLWYYYTVVLLTRDSEQLAQCGSKISNCLERQNLDAIEKSSHYILYPKRRVKLNGEFKYVEQYVLSAETDNRIYLDV